jgi:hypothetical protein
MFEGLFSRLNRLFAEYFLSGFEGIVDYEGEEIYLFSGDSALAGFSTYWGDILLNERLFQEDNEDLLNLFYLHEDFHRRHLLETFLGGLAQIFVSPQALVLHFALSFTMLINLVFSQPWLNRETVLLWLAIQFSIILVSSVIASLSELRAEISSVREIGPEEYFKLREKAKGEFPEPVFLTRISLLLTHPEPERVIKAYRALNQ